MKPQPKVLLNAMSDSVTTQRQGSVLMTMAHITPREHKNVSTWSSWCCCLVLFRTVPAPRWMQCFGELALSLTTGRLLRGGTVPHPGTTMELALIGEM